MDRDQLETFATIVEVKSFEKAAALLNISRGAVSQRIKALEESLSSILLVRDKPVVPTMQGEVLMRHVKALQLLEDASLSELMPNIDRSPVQIAIAVNADSLATWFSAALWPLLREKQVMLEVVVEDQDHTLSRLARGEVIGCISASSKPADGFIAEPLGCMEYRCYASRSFADKYFPRGITVREAIKAPALLFNRKDSLHDEFLTRQFGFRIEKYPKHYLPSPLTLLDAVMEDVGYGLLPTMHIIHRDASRLVDLSPDWPVVVPLYWHHWLVEPPQSRIITTLVREQAAYALIAPSYFHEMQGM